MCEFWITVVSPLSSPAQCPMAAVPSSTVQWCLWWRLTQCHIPQLGPQTTSGGPFKGTWGTWSACISQTGTPVTQPSRGAMPTCSNTTWEERHPSPTSDPRGDRRYPLPKMRGLHSTDWSCDCDLSCGFWWGAFLSRSGPEKNRWSVSAFGQLWKTSTHAFVVTVRQKRSVCCKAVMLGPKCCGCFIHVCYDSFMSFWQSHC